MFLLLAPTVMIPAAEYCRVYNTAIELPEKPSNWQKEAAAELKLHLTKMLKKPLKLNGSTPEKITFFIGVSADTQKAGFTNLPLPETLPGKFAIYRNNNDFLFYGWDSPDKNGNIYNTKLHCGSFFAVSYFLQKYLQVKYIMPGEKYVFYPTEPEVRFTAGADIYQPSYSVRQFGHGGKNSDWRNTVLWYRRRLGYLPERVRAQYSYFFINKWNKRFAHRPEFFALHDNRRINGSYPYHFPCTSNPEVVKQIVDDVAAEIKKNPHIKGVRFFCDAPVKSCECSNCRNSPAGKFISGDDHSETVYALLSQVGYELQKTYPDLTLHTQTKGVSYHQPPRSIKLVPNVVISILTAHFIRPDYDEVRKKCRQWRDAGATVLAKSYPRAPEMKDYPIMNPHRIAEYYRELAGYIEGTSIAECRGHVPWTFSALNNYVHSEVMSNANADVEKLINEFCALVVPSAAKELREFYDCMERLQATANFRDDPLMNCYIAFRLKEPRRYLDAALRKAPGSDFLRQLNRDFTEFEKKSIDCSGSVKDQAELEALFRGFAARQPKLQLTAADKEIEFRQFAFYRDYQPGRFKIRRDGRNLVITVECRENSMDKLITDCKTFHQGQIWNDDVVEIFFAAPGKAEPYLHITVNALGVFRSIRCMGNSKPELNDFPLSTIAVKRENLWEVKLEMPIDALKEYIQDNRSAFAIYRHRPSRGGDKNQMSGAQKPVNGAFRDITGRFEIEF